MISRTNLRLALLTVAVAGLPVAAMAQSQPFIPAEAPQTWKVDIGGGVVRGFSATGNNSDEASFTAWGSASYRDIVYANGLDGLGWNAIKRDGFHAGVQLRPRFAAGDIDGMDRPELGADAALYAYKRLPGNIVVGGRIQHDATGDDAGMEYYGSISHQRVTRVGLLQTMAYMRAADDERVQRLLRRQRSRGLKQRLHRLRTLGRTVGGGGGGPAGHPDRRSLRHGRLRQL